MKCQSQHISTPYLRFSLKLLQAYIRLKRPIIKRTVELLCTFPRSSSMTSLNQIEQLLHPQMLVIKNYNVISGEPYGRYNWQPYNSPYFFHLFPPLAHPICCPKMIFSFHWQRQFKTSPVVTPSSRYYMQHYRKKQMLI